MNPDEVNKIAQDIGTRLRAKPADPVTAAKAKSIARMAATAAVGAIPFSPNNKINQSAARFAKDVFQATARGGAALARSIEGGTSFTVPENASPIQRKLADVVFGQQKIPGIADYGDELTSAFGVNDEVKKRINPFVGVGSIALNFLGGEGAAENVAARSAKVIKALSKEVAGTQDTTQIFRSIDSALQRLPYTRRIQAAHDLTAVTDPKEAETYLHGLLGEGARAYNYTPEEAFARTGSLRTEAARLMERASPEVAAESNSLYRQINSIDKVIRDEGQGKAVMNEMVAASEDLFDRLATTIKATGKLPDEAVTDTVKAATADVRDTGVVRDGFAGTPDGRVTPVPEQGIQEGALAAIKEQGPYDAESAKTLQAAAEGRFPNPVEGDQLIGELGDHAEEAVKALESVPGGVLVRGIYANSPKEAAEKWLANVTHGHNPEFGNLDAIAIKAPDGSLAAQTGGGGEFFSERDIQNALLDGKKERGFATTIKESAYTPPEVAAQVRALYDPITNKQTLEEAATILQKGDDEALSYVRGIAQPTAKSNAVAQLLIEKFNQEGRTAAAVELVEEVAKKATSQAQAIQALSLWNRLTPAGVLRYAQKTLTNAGKKLTPELAQKLVEMSTALKGMDAGYEKSLETAKMLKLISDEIPVSFLKKVSLVQTMTLLLNPKTWIRNLVGNGGFLALENVSDVFAAMLDTPISLITGVRTKVPPSILTQSQGAAKGVSRGFKEAMAGVNTLGTKTQFDIPQTSTFKSGVGKGLETLLNVGLRVPDRMFYQAAFDGSIFNQVKAANITRVKQGLEPVLEPTEEMIDTATHDALYRTFQDDNALSVAMSGLKKVLNLNKDWGFGDVLIKFPRTPSALLMRGIDYSPIGFMKMAYQASRPLMKKTFDQKAFVEAFGRAITGTGGLIGTGLILQKLGILSGKPDDPADVNSAKRLLGLGDYKINASALKRFVLSGMNGAVAKPRKDDTYVNYDWAQPASIPVSIGANIAENNGIDPVSFLGTVVNSVASGMDTLVQQPVLSNLTKFMEDYGNFGAGKAFTRQLAGLPSSFVPTLLNQVRQMVDNSSRNTYSPDDLKYMTNLVKNRIPGLSDNLPQRYTTFGDKQETYQGGTNNPLNVLFNPMFVTKYKNDPAVKMVLDIYADTGDTGAVPDTKSYKQTINGKKVTLGPKTYAQFQKTVGEQARRQLYSLSQNPQFNDLQPQEKADYIQKLLGDIHAYGKIIILGDRPKSMSPRVRQLLSQYQTEND